MEILTDTDTSSLGYGDLLRPVAAYTMSLFKEFRIAWVPPIKGY